MIARLIYDTKIVLVASVFVRLDVLLNTKLYWVGKVFDCRKTLHLGLYVPALRTEIVAGSNF